METFISKFLEVIIHSLLFFLLQREIIPFRKCAVNPVSQVLQKELKPEKALSHLIFVTNALTLKIHVLA